MESTLWPVWRRNSLRIWSTTVLLGRMAVTTARVGPGDPLKHRVLDLASGEIVPVRIWLLPWARCEGIGRPA